MYGKIFEQIYDSSIAEDWTVRMVFQDFIVLSDKEGIVNRTHESIARRTNVPIEIVRKAIAVLEAPDPRSQSPNHEGRRIVRLDEHRDWGWKIVNHRHYRDIATEEQRRESTKNRVRKFRGVNNLDQCNANVTPCNAGNAIQIQLQPQLQPQLQSQNAENTLLSASPTCEGSSSAQKAFKSSKSNGYHPDTVHVLNYLNSLSGVKYREVDTNLRLISARLSEPGVTTNGVMSMITRKTHEWKGTERQQYLRPETLFGKTKFEGYYASRELPIMGSKPKKYVPNL